MSRESETDVRSIFELKQKQNIFAIFLFCFRIYWMLIMAGVYSMMMINCEFADCCLRFNKSNWRWAECLRLWLGSALQISIVQYVWVAAKNRKNIYYFYSVLAVETRKTTWLCDLDWIFNILHSLANDCVQFFFLLCARVARVCARTASVFHAVRIQFRSY